MPANATNAAPKQLVVAIDGPAGAGKSTVAKRVADALNYVYIDTGAMYRAITYKALRDGLSLDDADALGGVAETCHITFQRVVPTESGPAQLVLLDGEDVTAAIRHPEVTAAVSVVAAAPQVRVALRELQRRLAAPGGVVMDGRDIGSVVLPDADCKFYVTADVDERARRRQKDLEAQGHPLPLDKVRELILHRDHLDSTRAVSPLVQAPDAILVDTTARTVESVVDTILDYCRRP